MPADSDAGEFGERKKKTADHSSAAPGDRANKANLDRTGGSTRGQSQFLGTMVNGGLCGCNHEPRASPRSSAIAIANCAARMRACVQVSDGHDASGFQLFQLSKQVHAPPLLPNMCMARDTLTLSAWFSRPLPRRFSRVSLGRLFIIRSFCSPHRSVSSRMFSTSRPRVQPQPPSLASAFLHPDSILHSVAVSYFARSVLPGTLSWHQEALLRQLPRWELLLPAQWRCMRMGL